ELPIRAERGDDPTGVAVVGDVAPGAAGHQDLHARLAALLHQQHSAPPLAGVDRRHQPGCPGPEDRRVPVERRHRLPSPVPEHRSILPPDPAQRPASQNVHFRTGSDRYHRSTAASSFDTCRPSQARFRAAPIAPTTEPGDPMSARTRRAFVAPGSWWLSRAALLAALGLVAAVGAIPADD